MPAPPVSALTLSFFERIVRRYLRKHFRSLMVQRAEILTHSTGPLIVYMNHSSWWDPMVGIFLARTLLPRRKHYAPIDGVSLRRYRILGRIGLFPIEINTPRAAEQFLQTSEEILRTGGILWLTPQGRFADTRETPLAFKHGLATLAAKVPEAKLLPLAVEYTFWSERLPEILVRFGDLQTASTTAQLEAALATTMADLQAASTQRKTAAFSILLTGTRGTGGFYAITQRLRNLFSRNKPQRDHSHRDEGTLHRMRK